jgi:succinate dehydrogenase / fumarate reductase, cytochrome b subunit
MYVMTLPRTTIGKKIIMAVTGLVGVGFIIGHMYGNLKAFMGPVYFNEYAEGLRAFGEPLFGHLHLLTLVRIVLLASLVLHVWAAVALTRQAQRARPSAYAMKRRVQANYASITMRWGGLALFLFVIYHLAHFTWGVPGIHNDFIPGDAYHNLVAGFSFAPITIIYILAVVALGLHLYHGGWSMFQTLGLSNDNTEKPLRAFAAALAIVVTLGFIAVPIGVLVGLIR